MRERAVQSTESNKETYTATRTQTRTQPQKTCRTFLAEGIETALSLKEAGFQGKIVATLGVHNFKHYVPTPHEKLILCGDHDTPGSSSALVLEKIVKSFQDKGYNVECVVPDQEGQDFNDILKIAGQAGIQEAFLSRGISREVFGGGISGEETSREISEGLSREIPREISEGACWIPQEDVSSDTSRDLLPQKTQDMVSEVDTFLLSEASWYEDFKETFPELHTAELDAFKDFHALIQTLQFFLLIQHSKQS